MSTRNAPTRPLFVTCELCKTPVSVAAKGRVPTVHKVCADVQYALTHLSAALERYRPASPEAAQVVRKRVMGFAMGECNARFNRGKPCRPNGGKWALAIKAQPAR